MSEYGYCSCTGADTSLSTQVRFNKYERGEKVFSTSALNLNLSYLPNTSAQRLESTCKISASVVFIYLFS